MTQIGKNIATENFTILSNGNCNNENIATGKIIIFAVPGAFTPTCSEKHLPEFIEKERQFKDKGVNQIYCLSVNDKFVMSEWAKQCNMGKIKMIADGSATFTKKYDLVLDLTKAEMGIRSKRYAMIVKNGVIENIVFDDDSFAQEVLAVV